MNKSCYSVDDIHTGKLVKVEVPQYLSAAKSYALAADSSSSYAPEKQKRKKKKQKDKLHFLYDSVRVSSM